MPEGSIQTSNVVVQLSMGGKSGGGVPRAAEESPNTLRSKAKAKVLDLICEGPIIGLYKGAESIFLDETPLQEADGTYNFDGLFWDIRTGTFTQTSIPGFSDVESEVAVQARFKKTSSLFRQVTNPEVDRVRLKIRIPALLRQDKTNGDILPYNLTYAIDIKSSGGDYVQQEEVFIKGKNTAPFERQHEYTLTGSAPWDIRVRRVSDDHDEQSEIQDESWWDSYTEITDVQLYYPNSAMIGAIIDSEQFGQRVPVRSYLIKGKICRVPTNYDPVNRTYTGFWDGTYKSEWTNNPVWCYLDMVTDDIHGLGEYMDDSEIDKWELYSIAQFCDEYISDGFGGFEPRFTFNATINTRREAYQMLNTMVSTFRGMQYWTTGSVHVVAERPQDIEKIVTPANVVRGDFNYSSTARKSRHNAALVSWNDPNDFYRPAVEVYVDRLAVNKYGWNQTDVAKFGCTSRGEAHRYAKWIVTTEQGEVETVTYQAGVDHADVFPGSIIGVLDPGKAGVRMGGRLASATATTLTFDKEIELETGLQHYVTYMTPDGNTKTVEIAETTGMVTTVTLTVTLPDEEIPIVGAMYGLLRATLQPRKFRVLSRRETEKHLYEIVALEVMDNKQEIVEDNLYLTTTDNYTSFPTGSVQAPTGLIASESLFISNNAVRNKVTLAWNASGDTRVIGYDVQYQRLGDIWRNAGTTNTNTIDLFDITPAYYNFSVRAITPIGVSTRLYNTDPIQVLGKTAPPGDVENLVYEAEVASAVVSWDPVEDLDLTGYVVKRGSVGDDWSSATYIDEIRANSIEVLLPTKEPYAIMVRAIDELDNLSVNTTTIEVQARIPDDLTEFHVTPSGSNVLAQWDALPYPGVKYEIRSGLTWATGEVVGQFTGDFASFHWPGTASTTFWIKPVSDVGLYSINSRFAVIDTWTTENRNYIELIDSKDEGWPGVRNCMELDVNDNLMLKVVSGVPCPIGQYWRTVTLPTSIKSRVWGTLDIITKDSDPLIWTEATFTWLDDEAANPWGPTIDAQSTFKKYIAVDEALPSGLIEAFNLNGTLTGVRGTGTDTETGTFQYSPAQFGTGLVRNFGCEIDYSVAFNPAFSLGVRLAMDDTQSFGSDFLICMVTDGTDWIKIYWDASLEQFVAEGSDTNILSITPSLDYALSADHIYIGLSQTSTDRTLYQYSPNNDVEVYDTGAFTQITTFDTLQLFDSVGTLGFNETPIYDLAVWSTGLDITDFQDERNDATPHGFGPLMQLIPGEYTFQRAIIGFTVTAPITGDLAGAEEFYISIDVPDVVDAGVKACAVGWNTVIFTKTFHEAPKDVRVTVIEATVSPIYEIRNVTKTGFEVRLVKANNRSTEMSGTINWSALGY